MDAVTPRATQRMGGQTLSDSARLRRSFTREATSTSVTVGTNVEYAAAHQFGRKIPPRTIVPQNGKALFWPGARHPVRAVKHPGATIPARPFLLIRDEDWQEIKAAATDFFMEGK